MKITTLKNGLKIAKIEKPSSETVALLLIVKVGSRHESPSEWGAAHFLEHMVFKGTNKRPTTLELSEYLDKIGGEYNAFTGNEYTGFHAHVAKKYTDQALEFLVDLVQEPLLREQDFETEKGVILEEINLYEDMPTHRVDDLFSEALFGEDSLAHRISGSSQSVGKMSFGQLSEFYKKHYSSNNMMLVVVANNEVLNLIDQKVEKSYHLSQQDLLEISSSKAIYSSPRVKLLKKPINQGNLIVGFEGCNFSSLDRLPLVLMATLLGGMMSSRMFINIREKLGLCYHIRTSQHSFKTTGIVATQAGFDPANTEKAVRAILDEYKIIKSNKVSTEELNKTKEYFKGQMSLDMEDSEELAEMYGHQLALTGVAISPKELADKVDSVSVDDILRVANKYLIRETLTLALVSPEIDQNKVERLINAY